MSLLGGVLGAALSCVAALGVLLLRPALARGLGPLGWVAAIGLTLWAILGSADPMTTGVSVLYLGLALLGGLLFAVPRRVQWPHEAVWVSWGVGLLAALALTFGGLGVDAGLARLLPPPQKALVSFGMVNGLIWSLLPAVGAAAWWAGVRNKEQA